jgi:hypothetical protein
MIALAGLAAAPLIGVAFRTLVDRQQTRVSEVGPTPRFRVAVIRLLAELASLAVFGVFLWAALLWISRGVPILRESADQLVWFALKWRLLITALMIVVSPQRADLRVLAIDDSDARICFWWLAVYFAVISLSSILIWLVERLGFGHDTVSGAALALGLPIVAYKVAMYCAIRHPIARDSGSDGRRARIDPARGRSLVALVPHHSDACPILNGLNRILSRKRRFFGV